MTRRDWAKRLASLAVAVVVVIAVAGAGAVVVDRSQEAPDEPVALPEYQPENVTLEKIEATGEIRPNRSATTTGGTVLIDAGHGNRFDRATIQPLVDALVRVGYDVEFYTKGDLAAQLEDAKAFVVIDPATEYKEGDVEDVRRFTGQGGHLLLVGEPNRIRIGGFLGLGLTTQESALTTLASSYGMSVDTGYLYNQENADGNYKWITTRATDAEGLADVERTTMYTAARVRARGGTVLLRSSPNTLQSTTDDESGQYPVAVRKKEVVLVGDKTFLQSDRYRVADNEAFAAYLVEFLASSDREEGRSIRGGSGGGGTPTPPSGFPSNVTTP